MPETQDEHSIVETITRLFLGTDNRDWNAVQRCFAPRVLFDMTSLADHLVRSQKDWKIDRFKFNLKFIDGNPNLEQG
jgi:hypothetical protein